MTDIITMPESLYSFAAFRFVLITANTVSAASAFNQFARSDGPSAEFWQVVATFTTMKGVDLDELRRFFLKLKGGKVLARLYDKSRVAVGAVTQPKGAGGSTSTINVKTAAAAGDESITLKNLIASQAIALRAMDQLGIGENVYAVMDSSPSDGNGWSTVNIRPPLRMGIAVDDPVNLVKPTGLFRLVSGDESLTLVPGGGQARSDQVTLSFIEEPEFV